MNFNKIQPQQLQMPTFFSNSGDLAFTDLTTGFKVELSRFLTGDFDISGDLTINFRRIPQMSPSIVFDRDRGMLIGGTNSTISGEGNFVVNGDGNLIGGEDNTILFSKDSYFQPASSGNVLIGGNTVTFPSGVTGSMMLGDNNANREIEASNTIYVEFDSGQRFINGTVFEDNIDVSGSSIFNGTADFENNFTVNAPADFNDDFTVSGDTTIIGDINGSGNFDVTGSTFDFTGSAMRYNGEQVALLGYVNDAIDSAKNYLENLIDDLEVRVDDLEVRVGDLESQTGSYVQTGNFVIGSDTVDITIDGTTITSSGVVS